MFRLAPALCLILAACDSPSPMMQGATHHETEIGDYRITVWQQAEQVEIIRHGMARRADQPQLRAMMVQAAQQTTGCHLRPDSIEGDTGVLRARLDCSQPDAA
ncbi:MAG: hypothetical protein JJU09_06090 [Rhodobacteraceae bacterium]|nr:hypothetical protein [Paracoccaceae bacterium]TVR47895.1 MAG: hypothetical protein EA386_06325 [Paracoccaceae bacterium]